jgi:hypothetical protein
VAAWRSNDEMVATAVAILLAHSYAAAAHGSRHTLGTRLAIQIDPIYLTLYHNSLSGFNLS